jgi:4-amino-4-deoxy-L-arabinose transferase-like glycosyltransferase
VARLRDRRVLLAGIVLLALACRLAGIGDRLSADEGYSWLVGNAVDPGDFRDLLAAYENTPPLFYLLLLPLPLHDDEVWLRLPSLIAGVAAVPVLYAAVRALLDTRAALLSALALAVAPYAVSFSNYARGFSLATLGLLVALWAAARLATGGPGRTWWWVYAVGAVAALYSEYVAALFLVPLALVLRRPLAFAPFLAMLPWIGEISYSRESAGITKVDPTYPGPSPGSLRDTLVPLAFGEHGSGAGVGLRWVQFLALAVALAGAAAVVARRSRTAVLLLGGTAAGTLVLHALTALVGPDVFAPRYLTALIPLGAALLGSAVASLRWRAAASVAALALVAAGLVVIGQRTGRELEPDYTRAEPVVRAIRPRVVLTNSAVIAYYLDPLHPILDRPFGLGPGLEVKARPPYAVVDDSRVGQGARPGRGAITRIGPIVVRTRP